jgi:hypothetical protein
MTTNKLNFLRFILDFARYDIVIATQYNFNPFGWYYIPAIRKQPAYFAGLRLSVRFLFFGLLIEVLWPAGEPDPLDDDELVYDLEDIPVPQPCIHPRVTMFDSYCPDCGAPNLEAEGLTALGDPNA